MEKNYDSIKHKNVKENLKIIISQSSKFGKNHLEAIDLLGKPIKIINNQPFWDLCYEGLHIQTYQNGYSEQIKFISLTKYKFQMELELNIGSSKDFLLSVLGEPEEIVNEEYIYSTEAKNGISYVCFYFLDEKIIKIDWEVAI